MNLTKVAQSALDMVMPRTCPVCGKRLSTVEKHLCRACLNDLPRTMLHNIEFNSFEQLFAGKVPVERAAGLFWYERGDSFAQILHDIKYRNTPTMGRYLATIAAKEMQNAHFFSGIDYITPVPLHKHKLASRGYNQSEYIARGLCDATGLPLASLIIATHEHSTQTRKSAEERTLNTTGLYEPIHKRFRTLPPDVHILVVDDVVTTGSTLLSCIEPIHLAYPQVKFSLFTLAVARIV